MSSFPQPVLAATTILNRVMPTFFAVAFQVSVPHGAYRNEELNAAPFHPLPVNVAGEGPTEMFSEIQTL